MMTLLITFIRSTLFNLFFYGLNAIACFLCIPFLFMSHAAVIKLVHSYVGTIYILERLFLNLSYEVRGAEHLPDKGPYIIAAKHQSPYETFKLHRLFGDPAIILKQELLSVPIWGKFLGRVNPIAINRKAGKTAMKQVVEGALRVKAEGRPIVIFPQGTRVYPWETTHDKPYKAGLARMQEATELPVIPMALNSGMFWPRKSWLKGTGKVVFEFLPPATPGDTLLEDVEKDLESRTLALQEEALNTYPSVGVIYKPPQSREA